MEKKKDTYKVEERKSKAFVDPGSSGSAAEETPAASHLRKLDAMLTGSSAGAGATISDDPQSRLAAVDDKFAGFDNATTGGGATAQSATVADAQSGLAAKDAQFAGFDNATTLSEAQVRLGTLDAKVTAGDDTAGGSASQARLAEVDDKFAGFDNAQSGGEADSTEVISPITPDDEVYRGG